MASKLLCEYGGYTQREVGDILKIGNGVSVSKQLQKISNLLTTDLEVKKLQDVIVPRLKLKKGLTPESSETPLPIFSMSPTSRCV